MNEVDIDGGRLIARNVDVALAEYMISKRVFPWPGAAFQHAGQGSPAAHSFDHHVDPDFSAGSAAGLRTGAGDGASLTEAGKVSGAAGGTCTGGTRTSHRLQRIAFLSSRKQNDEAAGQLGRFFSLCQFGDRLSRLVQCRKPLFERSDSVPKIVAARCENPRENRIGGVGSVKYPGAFLFGSNVAIEQLDDAIEIADHLSDLYRLSLRGFASIKMTLVSHWVLQNDPDSQRSARAPWILGRNRKNSAKGSAAQHSGEAGAKVYCEERCRYRHDRHEPANSHLESGLF
jgi:hypothetical protein